jgi:hypothetical protein
VSAPSGESSPWASLVASVAHERKVLSEFFAPTRSLAPLADRVAAVLDAVPHGVGEVVLWMPGSAEAWVPPELDAALVAADRSRAVLVPYEASWRLVGSLEDGVALLGAVLDGLAGRPAPVRVLLAGLSQGAWAIARVMADPDRRARIARVVLFGLPGVSLHRPPPTDADCLVVNHPGDPVVYPLRRHQARVREAVDRLASGQVLHAVPGLVAAGAAHPGWLGMFAWSKLQPWLGRPDPHHYGPDMAAGVAFLLRKHSSEA